MVEIGTSLGSALAALIIGIVLVIISRSIAIEHIINTILYVIGAILVVVGIILIALYFVGIIV